MRHLASWLREPLLHFAVLGAAIFAVDAAVAPQSDAARQIDVTPAVREELVVRFQQSEGRAPAAAELDGMIDGWIAEEVLYREGRALGLDQGDAIIRDRVVQAMRALLQNTAVVDPPDEAELRAWFETHRARFDTPARFDFVEMQVKGGEPEALRLAEGLRRAFETGEGAIVPDGHLVEYRERPRPNLVAMFGEDFTAALEARPDYEWHALRSQLGWHLVRVDGKWPAEPASFEAMRAMVAADWEQAALADRARQALDDMMAGYRVSRPAPEPARLSSEAADGAAGG